MENECIAFLCSLLGKLFPFEAFAPDFMRLALLGLLIIAPMAAVCGTQVVNFRMSFFSDAIGHSAFAGAAVGLVAAVSPNLTMPLVALLVGWGIVLVRHYTSLAVDTVIGVFFSGVVAAGLAVVSRHPETARDMGMFLYGDILTISERDIITLSILLLLFMIFEIFSFNKLICIGLNAQLAKAHRILISLHLYIFAAILSLVVIFSVKAVGVLLVTAMLITPAAAARNIARSYGAMVWISILIAVFSSVAGLYLSAQDWMRTAAGATIVLCSCVIFTLTLFFRRRTRS